MNFNRSIYILWSHAFYSLLRVPKCSAAKIQMLLSLLSSWQCLGALPQQDMQGASLDIETLSTGPGVLWNELDEFVRSLWTSLKRKSLPGYGWKLEYSRDHNIDYYKVHFVDPIISTQNAGKTCSQGSTTTNSHEYQHHVCVSWFGSILKQQPSPLRLSSIWGIWPLVAWTNWVEIDSLRASKHSEQKSSRRWWPSPHINEKHQSIQACVSLCSHSAPENGNGGLLETNFLLETTTSRCYCWWFRNPAPLDMVNIPLFTGL